jgi:tetratricopeptide (TPR) repeat protein
MIRSRILLSMICAMALLTGFAAGQPPADKKPVDKKPEDQKPEAIPPPPKGDPKKPDPKKPEPKVDDKKNDGRLPHTKLMPAKLMPNLSDLKYRVSTTSPECQAFFDQGIAYYYAYVWMEAARSFETALKYDPDCALAWWGLSKACEKWTKPQAPPLKKAQELLPFANEREKRLIKARLQEKGMIEGIKAADGRKEAVKTLDELLALFDDDEEGWFARAQVADGPLAAIPFYKALLRFNPRHPGAHHELIHQYEDMQRPALGWQHAEGFLDAAPGIPHANHMQAHLAMRIGKWEKTTDRSVRAVELQEAYHKLMNVKPSEDHQCSHHYETLLRALIHDGRFKEANEVRKKCEAQKINHRDHWFRLALAQRDWDGALKLARNNPKDKTATSYLCALVYLKMGDHDKAGAEVKVLREAKGGGKDLELRRCLAEGLFECGSGDADAGLKLLAKAVDKTKDDYARHAWGFGSYYMEYWGLGALRANRLNEAEEAFLEALAHDSGSVGGALGMQVVCERQGRMEEARRFADLAERCWRKADAGLLQAELQFLRGQGMEKK